MYYRCFQPIVKLCFQMVLPLANAICIGELIQNLCLYITLVFWAAPVAKRLRAPFLNHSIISSSSSPALATCETSQVLLADVPGVFSRGTPIFVQPTDWPISYELK